MRCEEAKEYLQDYLDGLLDKDKEAELERHLNGCSACAAEYDAFRRLLEQLRSLPKEHAPKALKERIHGALAGEKLSFWRSLTAVSTAAAALLLALLLFSLYWQPTRSETPPPEEITGSVRPAPKSLEEGISPLAEERELKRQVPKVEDEDRFLGRREAAMEPASAKMKKKAPPTKPASARKVGEKGLKEGRMEEERLGQKVVKESANRLRRVPSPPKADGRRHKGEWKAGCAPAGVDREAVPRPEMELEKRKKDGSARASGWGLPPKTIRKQRDALDALKELKRELDSLYGERQVIRIELDERETNRLLQQLSSLAENEEKIVKYSETKKDGSIEVVFETDERGWRNIYSLLEPGRSLSDKTVYGEGELRGKRKVSVERSGKAREPAEKEAKKKIEIIVIVKVVLSEEHQGDIPSSLVK